MTSWASPILSPSTGPARTYCTSEAEAPGRSGPAVDWEEEKVGLQGGKSQAGAERRNSETENGLDW